MDGSMRACGTGFSAVLWASYHRPSPSWVEFEWQFVASISLNVAAASVVQTEMVAALLAYALMEAYVGGKHLRDLEGLH